MELRQTAIHEAGHVVVGYVLGLTCNEVALTHEEVEKTNSYGYQTGPNPMFGYEVDSLRERNSIMRAECVSSCAGIAAEHVFFDIPLNTDNENAQGDFQNVIECERQGLRTRRYQGGYIGDDVTWGYISRLLREAKKLVQCYSDTIQRFADTLIKKKKLSGEEVEQLLTEWMLGLR